MFCISNKWHNEPRLYSLLHLCTSLSTRCHTGWKQHQIIGSRDANKLPGTIRRRRKVPEGGHGCWSCTVETQQHTSGLRPCSGCHLKLVWEIWSSVTNINCLRVRAERCVIRSESVWHTVRLERHQTTTTSRVWLYAPGGRSDASEWEWDPSSREQKTDIQILSGLSVRSGEHQDHGWTCPQMFLETSAGLAARLMTPPTDVKAGWLAYIVKVLCLVRRWTSCVCLWFTETWTANIKSWRLSWFCLSQHFSVFSPLKVSSLEIKKTCFLLFADISPLWCSFLFICMKKKLDVSFGLWLTDVVWLNN